MPTSRLARNSWSMIRFGRPWGTTLVSSAAMPARTSDSTGPATETRNSWLGVGGSSSISEKPPSG